jgi:aminoglycoside phosphotransferase (APT) family kinase protein
MSAPGREFIDLLSATVALGAYRSVLADVLTLAPAMTRACGTEAAPVTELRSRVGYDPAPIQAMRSIMADGATAPPADLDDWTRRHVRDLAALETQWLPAAEGKTLLHDDINQSNLLIDDVGRVVLLDWAQPVCGAVWIDVADLVPHLILAGHTPAAAEAAIADVPTWRATDPAVITSYATAFAGYWARNSRRPAPPGVPHLRAYQGRAATAATTWVAHRVSWLSSPRDCPCRVDL